VIHNTKEPTRSDLGITYRKGNTPDDHFIGLGMYFGLGVRVEPTIVVTGWSDAKLRRQG
jgi:hypothetical protein